MPLLIAILLFGTISFADASYSNDSSSIDINYSGSIPGGGADDPDSGGGSEGDSSEGGGSSEEDAGSSGDNPIENSPEVTVIVTTTTSGTGAGTNGSSSSGNGTNGAGEADGNDILNTLFGNQALIVEGGSQGNGVGGQSSGNDSTWGSIRIIGAKARAALGARGISGIDISFFRNKFRTKGDAEIVLASNILKNTHLEEVVLSLNTFSISYKAQGRLFGVFPMGYPVHLTVNPLGATPAQRAAVVFPWYSFFLTKYQSKSVLQSEIDATVVASVGTDSAEDSGVDLNARVFTAVSDHIKGRLDTTAGSL